MGDISASRKPKRYLPKFGIRQGTLLCWDLDCQVGMCKLNLHIAIEHSPLVRRVSSLGPPWPQPISWRIFRPYGPYLTESAPRARAERRARVTFSPRGSVSIGRRRQRTAMEGFGGATGRCGSLTSEARLARPSIPPHMDAIFCSRGHGIHCTVQWIRQPDIHCRRHRTRVPFDTCT